jgi:multiple sugar transport system permease protein
LTTRQLSLRDVTGEAKLLLIGIPVLLWTMLPIYHLFLFAISPKESALGGQLWPDEPTLQNFRIVFNQQHHYLEHFWLQMWNSLVIAVAAGPHAVVARRALRSAGSWRRPYGDEPGASTYSSAAAVRCTMTTGITASSQ